MNATIIAHLKQTTSFEDWPTRQVDQSNLFIRRYLLGETQMKGWHRARSQTLEGPAGPRCVRSTWVGGRKPEKHARVDVYECSSSGEAHEVVIKLLSERQANVNPTPVFGDVGDVAFSRERSFLFSRSNVVVRIRNVGNTPFSVQHIAKTLDEDLCRDYSRTDKTLRQWLDTHAATITSIIITHPDQDHLSGLESIVLSLPPRDAEPKPLWYKLFSPTGAMYRSNGDILYEPQDRGEQRITVYAVTEDRHAAPFKVIWSL
jgi:hypothetical protein